MARSPEVDSANNLVVGAAAPSTSAGGLVTEAATLAIGEGVRLSELLFR